MVPEFALFLSPDGIALAHRQPAGHWAVLGDTALDVPDLGAELIRLRKLAEQRVEGEFETFVLLPDDQILFTSLTAPGPTEVIQRAQIEEGLDGLTPYSVEELVYDYHPLEDGRVKLAVVAKETLEEATEFATSHGFKPAGFGARPLDNRYSGVAHFDRTLAFVDDLPEIEFGPDQFYPAPAAMPDPEEDGETEKGDTTETTESEDSAPDVEAVLEPEESPKAPSADSDPEAPSRDVDDAPKTDAPVLTDPVSDPVPDLNNGDEAEALEDAEPGFVSRRSHEAPPAEPGKLVATRQARFAPATDADEDVASADAPKTTRKTGARATTKPGDPPSKGKRKSVAKKPRRPKAAGPAPDLPPLARVKNEVRRKPAAKPKPDLSAPERPEQAGPPPAAAAPDENSLRARLVAAGKRFSAASSLKRSKDPDEMRSENRQELGALLAKDAEAKAVASEPDLSQDGVGAPKPKRRRFKSPVAARVKPEEPKVSESDAPIVGGLLARDTIAGANGPNLRTGLILTMILVAVLGLVALWAMFYLPNTALGRWMGLGEVEEGFVLAGAEPSISAESGFVGAAPSADDAPIELSSLSPSEEVVPTPQIAAPDLLPDIDADLDLEPLPVAPPMIDPETVLPSEEENADFYARTGVWQRPPVITLPRPETELQGVIFAGLDPIVASHDAILLVQPDFLPSTDLPSADPQSGVAATGLRVEDLVEPSLEGTIAPYGAVVFSGPPSVLPRQRPIEPQPVEEVDPIEAAIAEAVAEAETTDVAEVSEGEIGDELTPGGVDTALLAAYRPEARPGNLQEQQERFELGGITYSELAAIRPEGRPQSLQEVAAEAAGTISEPGDTSTATILAVAISTVPASRPSNIDELVAEARAAGNSGPVGPVAASSSDTIQPDIPSSASVTRAATEENVLNLRRINLIGISGATSERRALVRMPSGRFVTVEVGDRLDGGRVAAISESSLQYVKSGRTITLEVPTG